MRIPNLLILKKKRIMIPLGIIVLIIAAALFIGLRTGTTNIATFDSERGEFIIDIRQRGELKAAKSVTVKVPDRVWGNIRIVKIVDDGAIVKEEDFLIQFDTSEADQHVKDRQNNLDNAKAEFESQKANIESSMKQLETSYLIQQYSYEQSKLRTGMMEYEADVKRREHELNMKKADLTLNQAKEKIESQKIIDKARFTQAEIRIQQAEMQLQRAQDRLDALTVKAPKGGLVVLKEIWSSGGGRAKVKVGDTPWRGQDLLEIPDLSKILVKTNVSEVDIGRIEVAQQVIITLDALEDVTFEGKIAKIAALASRERGSDVKVFDIEIAMEGTDERLKPGMTAQCQIVTETFEDVLFVPLESVFEKEDTTVVYVKKGGFESTLVKLGKKNSDHVIIEEGLEEGDVVALRDPTQPLEELGMETTVASENGNQ